SKPLRLLWRRLAPQRRASHIIDEVCLVAAETRAAILTERRHCMPRGDAINAAKAIGIMLKLRLNRAYAIGTTSLVAGVVKLLHLGFGKLAAIGPARPGARGLRVCCGPGQRAQHDLTFRLLCFDAPKSSGSERAACVTTLALAPSERNFVVEIVAPRRE